MRRPGISPHMSNPEPDPAAVLAALGDPTRLQLVSRLAGGDTRSIADLCSGLALTRQGVTKHLRVLEKAGIVRSNRVGRESRFTYVPEPVKQACTYLNTVSEQWEDALVRLQELVET